MVAISKADQIGKKKPKRKKSKSLQKALIKKIDKACSLAVLKFDKGEMWDSPPLQGFPCNNHLIRRGQLKVRWCPLNMFSGSSGANYRHENNPNYMIVWFLNRYGQKVYEELVKLSVGEAHWTTEELEKLLAFWEKIHAEKIGRGTASVMYLTDFREIDHRDLYNAWTRRPKL